MNTNLSLDQEVSRGHEEISEAISLGFDEGEPDACRQAAEIVSEGRNVDNNKSASDADSNWEMAASLYQKACESGDVKACFELAWLHLAGVGVPQSDAQALDNWQRVINTESESSDDVVMFKSISMYMVGLCHCLGIGTELNLVTGWRMMTQSKSVSDEFVLAGQWALDWNWGKSIDAIQSASRISTLFFEHVSLRSENNTLLKHLEAVCYFYGFGTAKDQIKAVGNFTTLANSRFAASEMLLGACYYDGYVVEKNYETAVEWCQRSAEQGHAWGQNALGCCYYFGRGVLQDHGRAVEWFQTAAAQGQAEAQLWLGIYYYNDDGSTPDNLEAAEWFRKAADQGDARAQYWLGYYYDNESVAAQDRDSAVEWYLKAAEQGDITAQKTLGHCYYNGHLVAQDYTKAVEWHQKGADQGDAWSQYHLGYFYYYGESGVEQDYAQAVKWFRRAAHQGDVDAQRRLAFCYENADGVTQDYAKAVEWYRMAAEQGDTHAVGALENISETREFWFEKRTPTRTIRSPNSYVHPEMDQSSQSHRLVPVSTGKFLRPVKEFKMIEMPKSVEEVCGLFRSEEKEPIIIWIGDEDCFVHDWKTDRPEGYLFEFKWYVFKRGASVSPLYICCTTLEGAIHCLDSLFQPSMGNLDSSILSWHDTFDTECEFDHEPELCPFPCEILEKYIQQNQNGERCCFWFMTFTPLQCKTLATSGSTTHLVFKNCRFQDDGMAFTEAYLPLENQMSGPVRLEFHTSIPLDDVHFIPCLPKLQELTFAYVHSMTRQLAREVVSTELDFLQLSRRVKLNNVEAEQLLIDNVRQGRGPTGVALNSYLFGSRARFVSFCDALSDQNGRHYLKRLELSTIDIRCVPDPLVESALLAAWSGNLELTSFSLTSSHVTKFFWNALLHQISLQPSIQRLDLSRVTIYDSASMPKERTEHLANVILANEHLQQMKFCPRVFDNVVWMSRVIPALEHNEHREHFVAIGKIHVVHTRKAILAEALKEVSDRPSLLYALMHRNLDVIWSRWLVH